MIYDYQLFIHCKCFLSPSYIDHLDANEDGGRGQQKNEEYKQRDRYSIQHSNVGKRAAVNQGFKRRPVTHNLSNNNFFQRQSSRDSGYGSDTIGLTPPTTPENSQGFFDEDPLYDIPMPTTQAPTPPTTPENSQRFFDENPYLIPNNEDPYYNEDPLYDRPRPTTKAPTEDPYYNEVPLYDRPRPTTKAPTEDPYYNEDPLYDIPMPTTQAPTPPTTPENSQRFFDEDPYLIPNQVYASSSKDGSRDRSADTPVAPPRRKRQQQNLNSQSPSLASPRNASMKDSEHTYLTLLEDDKGTYLDTQNTPLRGGAGTYLDTQNTLLRGGAGTYLDTQSKNQVDAAKSATKSKRYTKKNTVRLPNEELPTNKPNKRRAGKKSQNEEVKSKRKSSNFFSLIRDKLFSRKSKKDNYDSIGVYQQNTPQPPPRIFLAGNPIPDMRDSFTYNEEQYAELGPIVNGPVVNMSHNANPKTPPPLPPRDPRTLNVEHGDGGIYEELDSVVNMGDVATTPPPLPPRNSITLNGEHRDGGIYEELGSIVNMGDVATTPPPLPPKTSKTLPPRDPITLNGEHVEEGIYEELNFSHNNAPALPPLRKESETAPALPPLRKESETFRSSQYDHDLSKNDRAKGVDVSGSNVSQSPPLRSEFDISLNSAPSPLSEIIRQASIQEDEVDNDLYTSFNPKNTITNDFGRSKMLSDRGAIGHSNRFVPDSSIVGENTQKILDKRSGESIKRDQGKGGLI